MLPVRKKLYHMNVWAAAPAGTVDNMKGFLISSTDLMHVQKCYYFSKAPIKSKRLPTMNAFKINLCSQSKITF